MSVLPITRISAYGLITDKDNILLCRLSHEVKRWQGHWILPGGGLEFGEHPEQAMQREVAEETGLNVTATGIATIDSWHDVESDPEFHGVRIIYFAQHVGGNLRYEIAGTTDKAAWFTYAEASRLPLVKLAQLGLELVFDQPAAITTRPV